MCLQEPHEQGYQKSKRYVRKKKGMCIIQFKREMFVSGVPHTGAEQIIQTAFPAPV